MYVKLANGGARHNCIERLLPTIYQCHSSLALTGHVNNEILQTRNSISFASPEGLNSSRYLFASLREEEPFVTLCSVEESLKSQRTLGKAWEIRDEQFPIDALVGMFSDG